MEALEDDATDSDVEVVLTGSGTSVVLNAESVVTDDAGLDGIPSGVLSAVSGVGC